MLFTSIKSWFFRNHLANFHQISHWSFCWNVIDSLFKWSCSIDCQAHIFFFKTKNCSNDDIFISCDDRIGKMLHNICLSAMAMSLRWANRGPWASLLYFPATVLFTCIKSWFFWNHLANFHQISHWSYCWNVIDNLFKWLCSIDCQAHIFFFKTKNCSNDDLFIGCDDRIGKMLHNICSGYVTQVIESWHMGLLFLLAHLSKSSGWAIVITLCPSSSVINN